MQQRLEGANWMPEGRSSKGQRDRNHAQWKYFHKHTKDYWQLGDRDVERITERLPEGAEVLDIGCGKGKLIEQLLASRKNFKVTGAELDDEITVGLKNQIPGAEFITLDIIEDEIPRNFGVIVMKYSLGCLKSEKYSKEEVWDRVLEKVSQHCDQFVLITPTLKKGIDPEKARSVFVPDEILERLCNKYFGKREVLDNHSFNEDFYNTTYLMSESRNKNDKALEKAA